eukprot:maker-scaffold_7-snap-gene-19.83-mRNA-1 protein AED:0.40 eAED:0.49 QI:0/0/0/0.33/1/1/3/0/371
MFPNFKQHLYCWAEFVKYPYSIPASEDDKAVQVGNVYSRSELEKRQRSRNNLALEWYRGEELNAKEMIELRGPNYKMGSVHGDASVIFQFNKEKNGWNYKWVANVHTHTQKHTLLFYTFYQKYNPVRQIDELVCINISNSPVFRLCSLYNRRKHNILNAGEFIKNEKKPKVEPTNIQNNSLNLNLIANRDGQQMLQQHFMHPSQPHPYTNMFPMQVGMNVNQFPQIPNLGFMPQINQTQNNILQQSNILGVKQFQQANSNGFVLNSVAQPPAAELKKAASALASLKDPFPMQKNINYNPGEPLIPDGVKAYFLDNQNLTREESIVAYSKLSGEDDMLNRAKESKSRAGNEDSTIHSYQAQLQNQVHNDGCK